LSFQASGKGASAAFAQESGGHRWQRVPPNDKRGRVQTSTVTVAVLDEPKGPQIHIDDRDIEWITCRGSGAGGQHRNVTNSAVQMTHKPTGLKVRVENERSQHANRDIAYKILRARIQEQRDAASLQARSDSRRQQVGSGECR